MADSDNKSLNAHLLCSEVFPPTDVIDATSGLPFLEITILPFTSFVMINMLYNNSDILPFGIQVSTCSHLCHAYISSFTQPSVGCTLCATNCNFLGSYAVSIFDQLVFSTLNLVTINNLICSHYK